ncbi:MAG: nitrous oxide reductase family maturation protein NosD [Flavitalea sp.]
MKLFLTIISLLLGLAGFSKTIHVKKEGPVLSIKAAIEMAAPGDTVMVYPGRYVEQTITVNKKLYLKGIGYPEVDGERKYEIFLLTANGIVLEGFSVIHGGYSSYNDIAAIRILNARHVIVRNNKLFDTFFGIYSQRATKCYIYNNILSSKAKDEVNSANGIHCFKSDSMRIYNNNISGHRDGIYFEFVTNTIIQGNHSSKNVRYGLHFMFSHSNSYLKNTFKNNGAGVAVMYSHGVTMIGNIFSENWGGSSYGILLKDISDSHIEGNSFLGNTSGIYMEGTSRVKVFRNKFIRNGWAMKIQASCTGSDINENNFIANTFDVATNGSLVENNFDNNYWDKYEGYDLNRDGSGDVPYRPVSMYSMIVERNPTSMMLFRSFMVTLLDRAEKIIPGMTPVDLFDARPNMKPLPL